MPKYFGFWSCAVLLAVFFLPNAAAFAAVNHQHLRSRQQVQLNASDASNDTSLEALAESCKCSFTGMCSCVQALEFMKCIQTACDSSVCNCGNHHYFYACKSMKVECPKAGLQCAPTESTCEPVPPFVTEPVMELVDKLEDLRSEHCELEEAKDDGWINAHARQKKHVNPRIEDVVQDLRGKGVQPPSLGCTEKDTLRFEEFRAKLEQQKAKEDAEADAEATEATLEREAEQKEKREEEQKAYHEGVARLTEATKTANEDEAPFVPVRDIPKGVSVAEGEIEGELEEVGKGRLWFLRAEHTSFVLITGLVQILLVVLCAALYDRYRDKLTPKQSLVGASASTGFGIGLCSCFSDMRIFFIACFCPCLRWADTTDRAELGLSYWKAFAIFFALTFLTSYTYGISFLFLATVGAGFRGRLRRRCGVQGRPVEDCFVWLFCQPCSIVQEARVNARNEYEEWYAEQGGRNPDSYRG